MKNKIIIIISILFVMILSGCSNNDDKTSGFPGSKDSSGNGVVIEFNDANINPQKGNEFSLFLNIINYQRHDLDNFQIRPGGFDPTYVKSGLQREYNLNLKAATSISPNMYNLPITGIVLDGFTGDYSFDPIFKYCYTAKTQYLKQVCVPDEFGKCDIKTDNTISLNGPLSISLNKIYPIGQNEIGLDYEISNKLNGFVVNECFQNEALNSFGNEFTIVSSKLGSSDGNCEPISASDYQINNNKALIRCTFSRSGNEGYYASQANLEIQYNYQQEVKKLIKIRDLSVR